MSKEIRLTNRALKSLQAAGIDLLKPTPEGSDTMARLSAIYVAGRVAVGAVEESAAAEVDDMTFRELADAVGSACEAAFGVKISNPEAPAADAPTKS